MHNNSHLNREDGGDVVLEVAHGRARLSGELDLDAVVPEPLSQAARYQDEAGLSDRFKALGLQGIVLLGAELKGLALWYLRHPPLEGILALLASEEELPGVGGVRQQPVLRTSEKRGRQRRTDVS